MKKIIGLFLLVFSVFFVTSCLESVPSSDAVATKATEQALIDAHVQIGMPAISNFQEKKNLKWIYELCDREQLVCYAYLVDMQGGLKYFGQCIGYGIPYSTQYSNPEKVIHPYNAIWYTMPQAEPNGLFKPEGLSATWLIMKDEKTGQIHPVYVEPSIIVSPFKLH